MDGIRTSLAGEFRPWRRLTVRNVACERFYLVAPADLILCMSRLGTFSLMPCLRCKHTARRSSSRERKRSTCGPGASDISVAPYTTDGDLAIDPSLLGDDPELEPTMEDAGFRLKTQPGGPVEPGMWIVEVDIEGKPEVILVDLIVPESAASNSGRRGARLGPHAKRAARQIPGLESVLIDHSPIVVRRSIPRTVGRSKWKRPALQHSWSPKRTSCTTESTKISRTVWTTRTHPTSYG